jgi:hypothetical protein
MNCKFDIKELDEYNSNTIKYISSENTQNFNGGNIDYPMSWDISAANYGVKVYQAGNFYPNNQPNYHASISFYGADRNGDGSANAYFLINNLKCKSSAKSVLI